MLPTIDEMSKGLAGANIKRVLARCSDLRSDHRFVNRGYSPKKTHRFIGEIPPEFHLRNWTCRACYDAKVQGPHIDLNQYGMGCRECNFKGKIKNPYYAYFDPAQDKHERTKHRHQFLRKIAPQFKTVDAL